MVIRRSSVEGAVFDRINIEYVLNKTSRFDCHLVVTL
jgi:hypothetical protein